MKKSIGIKVAWIMAAVFAGAAVYFGLMGYGDLMLVAIALAVLCMLFMPAFYNRAKKVEKIRGKQNPLLCWEYGGEEAEEIVQQQKPVVFKKSVGLSILFSICFAVIFLPFYLMSLEANARMIPILPIALPCIVLPWLSIWIAPAVAANRIRFRPCVSVVGPNYVFVANRYPGVNDRFGLKAEKFCYEPSKDGAMATLSVQYGFYGRYGQTHRLWVSVPVPRGKEQEARTFAKG